MPDTAKPAPPRPDPGATAAKPDAQRDWWPTPEQFWGLDKDMSAETKAHARRVVGAAVQK